jgi:hypothetical protein
MENNEVIIKSKILQKCKFCKGKDGKYKDIYETPQLAFDTALFIEKDRGTYLNIYKCPNGNGWHLTKNNAVSGIIERQSIILQNNNIPLSSPDGSWEYIKDTIYGDDYFEEIINNKKNKNNTEIPIIKIDCKSETDNIEIIGKIMEIIDNVNIEKLFKITFDDSYSEILMKNKLDGKINQITLYVENGSTNQLYSYTILIKKNKLKKNNIVKGSLIKIDINGISINNFCKWCCNKIIK